MTLKQGVLSVIDIKYSLNVDPRAVVSPEETLDYTVDMSQESDSISSYKSYNTRSCVKQRQTAKARVLKDINASHGTHNMSVSDSKLMHLGHDTFDRRTRKSGQISHCDSLSSQYEEAESRLSAISIHDSESETSNSDENSSSAEEYSDADSEEGDELSTSQLVESYEGISGDETENAENALSGEEVQSSGEESEYSYASGEEADDTLDESASGNEHEPDVLANIAEECSYQENSTSDNLHMTQDSSIAADNSSTSKEDRQVNESSAAEESGSENSSDVTRYECIEDVTDSMSVSAASNRSHEEKSSIKEGVTAKNKTNGNLGKYMCDFCIHLVSIF